jgi:tRNA threonylcarbamoyladenosine biosynthesis protein TsaE
MGSGGLEGMRRTLSILRTVSLTIPLPDSAATETLARRLAHDLPAPIAAVVVHLRGELGAGKTTWARSLLQTLGVTAVVRSPTYTLVEPYVTAAWHCVHVDLYRLRGSMDLEDLGLRDYLAPGNLLLIEWPERGGSAVPAADLDLHLAYASMDGASEGRSACLTAGSDLGRRWLETYGSTVE